MTTPDPTPDRRTLAAPERRCGRGRSGVVRITTHETLDTFTLTLQPADGDAHVRVPAGAVQHGLRVRRRRGPHLDELRPGLARRATPSARWGRSPRRCAGSRPAMVGLRGPFGTPWPVDSLDGRDLVLVAGGIGLAPLRPAIYHILAQRARFGRVRAALRRAHAGRHPVRRGARDVAGRSTSTVERHRGLAPSPAGTVRRRGDPADPASAVPPVRASALVCGPEIMMRFTAQALVSAGCRADAGLRVARAEHEVRGRPLRALPARRRRSSARTARCCRYDRWRPCSASGGVT